jgi:hypothetical protein
MTAEFSNLFLIRMKANTMKLPLDELFELIDVVFDEVLLGLPE